MANFNETIKATKSGRISVASYCDIVICKTMKEFQKAVCNKNCHSKILLRTSMSLAKLRVRNEIETHRIAI